MEKIEIKNSLTMNSSYIDIEDISYWDINPSLDEVTIRLINKENTLSYPEYENVDYDNADDELSTKTGKIIYYVLKTQWSNGEILAVLIPKCGDSIIFFVKKKDKEESFRMLKVLYNYVVDNQIVMEKILDLSKFRYYDSGIYDFYMQDALTEYNFEVMKCKEGSFMLRKMLTQIEPIYYLRGNDALYFVIKNNKGYPLVVTEIRESNIETFAETLTKADPQAGILFSLSYNANK